MPPITFLILGLAITGTYAGIEFILRRRRTRELRALARTHSMHYCFGDRFRFASKIAEHFPVIGAADIRVRDLLYGSHDETHRYVFTVEFTKGVIRTKKRHSLVASFTEPRGQRKNRRIDLRFGDKSLTRVDQYRTLCHPG
jgi:hypothetical protein